MRRHPATAALLLLVLAGLAAAQHATTRPQEIPPGHPDIAPDPGAARPAPDPADVASIESIVGAYYASISGPVGAPRDWHRFRSLFLAEGVLVTTTSTAGGDAPLAITPEQFHRLNDAYFKGSGYEERSIHRRTESFGNLAQVFSTYETRRNGNEQPYARGVNGFQLLRASERWWIVSVTWDRERAGAKLPPALLP